MLTLTVNTCFSEGQICIHDDQKILGEKQWGKPLSHSEVITLEFSNLCKELSITTKDIGQYSCVIGPGSFTGIRVGVNFCRTLAYSNHKQVSAINSLKLLASNCSDFTRPTLTAIDAQKNSLFISIFEGSKRSAITENKIVEVKNLSEFIAKDYNLCGNGFEKYKDYVQPEVLSKLHYSQENLKPDLKKYIKNKDLSNSDTLVDWFELQPLYIKASAPEELLKAKQ